MKFQAIEKKVIDAEQFLPPDNIPEGVQNVHQTNLGRYLGEVITAQGQNVVVASGEWIVKEAGYEDRYYPIDSGIFDETYQPLEERKVFPGNDLEVIALEETVYPSKEQSVFAVVHHEDPYGGANEYEFRNSLGFSDGQARYAHGRQRIRFVEKTDTIMLAGLQSEQLVIALIDRTQKLDARFPCEENKEMITALKVFLEMSRRRVKNRQDRGVMGDLKK